MEHQIALSVKKYTQTTRPAQRHLRGDGDEAGMSFNKPSQLLKFRFQMTTVLSVSRQQPSSVQCERSQALFEKLILVFFIVLAQYYQAELEAYILARNSIYMQAAKTLGRLCG